MSLTLVRVGPVRTRSPSRVEDRVAVMGREESARIEACAPSASEGVWGDDRAGGVFRPVDPVAVAGDRPDVFRAGERKRKRQQELGVAPAASGRPRPIETVVSPPDSEHSRRGDRAAMPRRRSRDARHNGSDLARLALERVAEDERRQAFAARDFGRRVERQARRGDDANVSLDFTRLRRLVA